MKLSEKKDKDYCNDNLKLDLNKNTLHFNFIEGKRDVLQVSNTDLFFLMFIVLYRFVVFLFGFK